MTGRERPPPVAPPHATARLGQLPSRHLAATDYELETQRLIRLGAVKLNDYQHEGSRWTTFADPEGNEFDLVATP